MATISRRSFLKRSGAVGGGLAAAGPLGALSAREAGAAPPSSSAGYGPLVPKGDLALPVGFEYQVISRQGVPMRDGTPTPGIFDAMGAYQPRTGEAGTGKRTVLIRNHENRRRPGEIPVAVPPGLRYDEDPSYIAGCTKLVVERRPRGRDRYAFTVVDSFAILGGTDTNCAGGETPFGSWITCEEVVNRSAVTGTKHGYAFEVDATADGPVPAVPILAAGRFVHEATTWRAGILYQTEDRGLSRDESQGTSDLIGAAFYRYIPDRRIARSGNLAASTGRLEAARIVGMPRMNMDAVTTVGVEFPVEWVLIEEPDHNDDTDRRLDRQPGFTPTRVQAADKGAAFFDRMEGIWTTGGSTGGGGKVFFDCTTGGPQNLGQVWEYDPGRETLTLVYISTDRARLENPDNITIVPQTQDVLICEDSPGEQFIRGVTQDGEIYDFARTVTNDTEFCGAVFDPDGQVLYVNQQGERGQAPDGPPDGGAVTYAIYGPFERRSGPNNKNDQTGTGTGTGDGG